MLCITCVFTILGITMVRVVARGGGGGTQGKREDWKEMGSLLLQTGRAGYAPDNGQDKFIQIKYNQLLVE